MNELQSPMRQLLQQAGFRIRSTSRADCIHCGGRSRATVSFTGNVAFCHRCKWRANVVMLARELGLLRNNSQAASSVRNQAKRRAQLLTEIKPFEIWRDTRIREVSNRYRELSRMAIRAADVLSKFPDSEAAWDALARFYHAMPRLAAAFDLLMFTKASDWLDEDSTPVELYEIWRRRVAQ
jgi:hypothetical protein